MKILHIPWTEWEYPRNLTQLSEFIKQPGFASVLHKFIHEQNHPNADDTEHVDTSFDGPVRVFHSATAVYYSPTDLCGAGGMFREVIRAHPNYSGSPHYDTVLVSVGDPNDEMHGLMVARIQLLFSFFDPYFDPYQRKEIPCALVTWFVHLDDPPQRDVDTGMWAVCAEYDENGDQPIQIIHLDAILRGIHLLPCFGSGFLPENFNYTGALDAFVTYFVNQFIDPHAHKLLS